MTTSTGVPIEDEGAFARHLIEQIVESCPRRRATSADERRAQELVQKVFDDLGITSHYHHFTFNDSLYANLALHFGVGTLGTVVGGRFPALALALHLLSGGSYWLESVEHKHLLRRLLPYRPSQNLVALLPANAETRLRIVVPAHVDAAFTGLLFHPEVIRRSTHTPAPFALGLTERPFTTTTYSQLGLAAVDLARLVSRRRLALLRPLEWAATIPSLIGLAVNLQMVLRDEIVPGAADNLSGVVGAVLLAARLAPVVREHVELVFVVTGCEEAGRGGAKALADDMRGRWSPRDTVVLGLDTLSNGDPCYLDEGEIRSTATPDWLARCLMDAARGDPRFETFGPFEVPAGYSDVQAFRPHGYDGTCISSIDGQTGAPRHYHSPSDTPENLDYGQIVACVDLAERTIENIIQEKLGSDA